MHSGQRVCRGLRPAPDLCYWRPLRALENLWVSGCSLSEPCITHPRPAHAYAHLARSFILKIPLPKFLCA